MLLSDWKPCSWKATFTRFLEVIASGKKSSFVLAKKNNTPSPSSINKAGSFFLSHLLAQLLPEDQPSEGVLTIASSSPQSKDSAARVTDLSHGISLALCFTAVPHSRDVYWQHIGSCWLIIHALTLLLLLLPSIMCDVCTGVSCELISGNGRAFFFSFSCFAHGLWCLNVC